MDDVIDVITVTENVHDTSPHKVREGDAMLDVVMKAGEMASGEEEDRAEQPASIDQSEDNMGDEGQTEGNVVYFSVGIVFTMRLLKTTTPHFCFHMTSYGKRCYFI